MRIFVTSDVHADHWSQEYTGKAVLDTFGERCSFYEKFLLGKFIPADACIIAGDIANDSVNQIDFLKYISQHYKTVYAVFGNHDLTVNEFERIYGTSEARITAVREAMQGTNVQILENSYCDDIAGSMGFCDFSVMPKVFGCRNTPFYRWKKWYDGKFWNYMNQHPKKIRQYYSRNLKALCKRNPKIIVTHFAPIQLGIPFDYRNNSANTFFYFDAKPYLDMLSDGTIWVCGHTHSPNQVIYTNASGAKIRILCNPIGYPFDYDMYSLFNKKDFVVEI